MGTSFSACNNEAEEMLAQESEIRLTSEITPSRVTSLDYQSTQIVEGQQVGVTITGAKDEHNNIAWTAGVDGALSNTGEAVYYGNETATITAYHPYNAAWTGTSHTFSVSTDQSSDASYLASDLLWTTKTATKSEKAVALTFAHQLAKINVTLTSTDITDLSGATISICGTNIATNFNPSTGELSAATADVQEIKAGVTTEETYTASAIVVPQTIANGTKFIKVVHGSKTFYHTLTANKELKSGYSHNYTLTVKEKELEVITESEKITDWTDDNDEGNIGDANEEVFEITAVDLGLSVKWGSCSLGASKIRGMGDFYAWGEITPKTTYSLETYSYWNAETSSYVDIGTEISGTEYDPATAILGEGWRLPTKEECEELINNCDSWANDTDNRPYLFVMKSKKNEKSIYFGGYRYAAPTIGGSDYTAYFMSGSLSNGKVFYVTITADYHQSGTMNNREYGFEIRPVYDGE